MDDLTMDYMEDGIMDMNDNMRPVFKDEDFRDMNSPLDPSMMDGRFGMGRNGVNEFGSGYNMHMPNNFGSLGSSSVGNLHGPSSGGSMKSGGLGIASFAKESQFGSSKPPKFAQSYWEIFLQIYKFTVCRICNQFENVDKESLIALLL